MSAVAAQCVMTSAPNDACGGPGEADDEPGVVPDLPVEVEHGAAQAPPGAGRGQRQGLGRADPPGPRQGAPGSPSGHPQCIAEMYADLGQEPCPHGRRGVERDEEGDRADQVGRSGS